MDPKGLASVPVKKITCPICKIAIYPATLAGHPLHHCAECEGTAWPRESLMKLRPDDAKLPIERGKEEDDHKTPPYFTPRQKPPFLICPLCSKRMKETKLGQVAVDICEKCTCMWLDGPKGPQFPNLLGPYKWKQAKRD
jgi:Zn-finger nucleic acid-binding protein